MDTSKKNRKELIEEIEALRLRMEELEHSEAERRKAEESIGHRFEFEKIISSISSRFVLSSNIEDNINNSFVDMGKLTGASRVYLFLFREDESFMDNTHEWCAEGVSPQIDNLKNLPCDTCPWWMAKLRKGELIHIEDVSKLPEEEASERKILKEQDIKSLLVLPVIIGGQLGGFIGFDNIRGTGLWSEEDLAILRISSEIIGNALEHKQAEDELRESEERLKVLFESAPDAIFLSDLKGNIVDGNRAAEKLMGYNREELIGKDFIKAGLISQEQIPKAFESLAENAAGKSMGPDEFTLKRKDGGDITLEIRAFLVNIRNQTLVLGIARDITERKKASEELRKSEQRYRDLWENVNDLIQSVAPDGSFVYVNRAWRETLGYNEEEIPQLSLLDIIHPNSHAHCMEIFKRLMSGEEVKNFEAMFLTRDGRTIVVEGSANCRLEDGKPVATRAIFRDITEHKKAEEALYKAHDELEIRVRERSAELRQSEERFRLAAESTSDLIYELDMATDRLEWFGDIDGALGFKSGEFPRTLKARTKLIHPDDQTRLAGSAIRHRESTDPIQEEYRILRKDGAWRYWADYCVPVVDSEGRPHKWIGACVDITDRKKAEETLKQNEEHYRIFASYQCAISELRNLYMVDATFEQTIQKTLDLIIEEFGYYMVWYAELIEEQKVILPKMWAGKYEKYLDGLRLEYESDKQDVKCAMSLAILTKKPFGYADLEHDKDFEKWRAFALQYSYRSNQAIPLVIDGKCKSAFLIYSTRPFAFSEKTIDYLKGIVDELAMIIGNIAERKQTQDALKKAHDELEMRVVERTKELAKINEELKIEIAERKKVDEKIRLFSHAVAGAIDAIAITDMQGIITYANPAKEKMYGYEKGQLIGKLVSALNPTPEIVEKIMSTIKNTGSWTGETLQQKKNKEIFPALLSFSLVKDEKGNPVAMMGAVRDITERRRAEEKFLEYQERLRSMASELSLIEERERRHIATELHDRVVQLLVFSKMRLDEFQASAVSTDFGKPLKEISDTLEQAIQETQTLTYDLGSPTLYELGLEAAVKEWLTEEIGQKHNIATSFKDDGAAKPLSGDISAFLFRAVRELLINVIKHAQAQKIDVSIQKKGGKIKICVVDDGIGFEFANTSVSRDKKRGYGLFSIKEHLSHIGGCLDIKSEQGSGTQAVLTSPLKEKDIKAES